VAVQIITPDHFNKIGEWEGFLDLMKNNFFLMRLGKERLRKERTLNRKFCKRTKDLKVVEFSLIEIFLKDLRSICL
jgi:hypothetical protein